MVKNYGQLLLKYLAMFVPRPKTTRLENIRVFRQKLLSVTVEERARHDGRQRLVDVGTNTRRESEYIDYIK